MLPDLMREIAGHGQLPLRHNHESAASCCVVLMGYNLFGGAQALRGSMSPQCRHVNQPPILSRMLSNDYRGCLPMLVIRSPSFVKRLNAKDEPSKNAQEKSHDESSRLRGSCIFHIP